MKEDVFVSLRKAGLLFGLMGLIISSFIFYVQYLFESAAEKRFSKSISELYALGDLPMGSPFPQLLGVDLLYVAIGFTACFLAVFLYGRSKLRQEAKMLAVVDEFHTAFSASFDTKPGYHTGRSGASQIPGCCSNTPS